MTALSPSRWKSALDNAIAEYKEETVFYLASLGSIGSKTIPRVRAHIFRDFLVDPQNPTLPLLVSTTDIRSPKVSQLSAHPTTELAWWIAGTKEQFRITGTVYFVPTPTHHLYSDFLYTVSEAEEGSGSGLAFFKQLDWDAKRIEVFRTLPRELQASWCGPVPGSPLQAEEAAKWPTHIEEPTTNASSYGDRQNWEIALENFALVVIDPIQVDYVELGVEPNRRTLFTKKEQKDGKWVWEEEALVP